VKSDGGACCLAKCSRGAGGTGQTTCVASGETMSRDAKEGGVQRRFPPLVARDSGLGAPRQVRAASERQYHRSFKLNELIMCHVVACQPVS